MTEPTTKELAQWVTSLTAFAEQGYISADKVKQVAGRLIKLDEKNHTARADAFEEAASKCVERSGREEYGHAKAACALDAEMLYEEAARIREGEGGGV